MGVLKKDVKYLTGMMEDMQHTQKLILDAVVPAKQRAAQLYKVCVRVDDHEHRISAVESVIKTRDL